MGLLTEGTPLSWEETKKVSDHVRKHGVAQFINLYNRVKDRSKDCLLWGDEIEYMLVKMDKEQRKATLMLKADSYISELRKPELENIKEIETIWRPEYAAYMVEGTPGKPYGPRMGHFNTVEANMRKRRKEVMKLINNDKDAGDAYPLTLTSFPRLGCDLFTNPPSDPDPVGGVTRSLFFPDMAINNGHPRFRTLSRNVRERRGEKPFINIPIFKDFNTRTPFIEDFNQIMNNYYKKNQNISPHSTSSGSSSSSSSSSSSFFSPKPDHIYMDCMGFGMGCCCLQVTFQACNINEARILYDQLTSLCPIMLALSAASPIYRGYLSDHDCRWDIISGSVDDRSPQERGLEPLTTDRFRISKSRYDSISSYLSPCGQPYNDIPLTYDPVIYRQLIQNGIDEPLSKHIAHLFIRDPISVFSEKLQPNDEKDTDHFENIQSTNWQTMRFKPPPPQADIGWRVEFRPMEVQLTDFENAAYVVFIVLLTRVILTYKLNLVIPISKVDENMKTAQKRGACRNSRFYFRKDITTCNTPKEAESMCCLGKRMDRGEEMGTEELREEYDFFSIEEIISGKPGVFPGLKPLIERYLKSVDDCDVDTSCTISQYLKFIEMRASGQLVTMATWTREFVTNHPDYKQDSVVNDNIAYDFIKECSDITFRGKKCSRLLMDSITKTNDTISSVLEKIDKNHADMAAKHNNNKNNLKQNQESSLVNNIDK